MEELKSEAEGGAGERQLTRRVGENPSRNASGTESLRWPVWLGSGQDKGSLGTLGARALGP